MTYDFYGLPEDFVFQEKENVEKVTPAAVLEAAKANLHPDAVHVLVVGKGEDFGTPLEELGLGPVDTLDFSIPSGEEKKELSQTPENLAKGREILAKAVQAHGGVENFKKINSVSRKENQVFIMGGTEIPIKVESIEVFPDKIREVASIMGRTIYQIRNGDTGWKTDQMTMALSAMSEEDFAQADKEWARNTIHIFEALDDPYYQPVYDGSGMIGDVAVEFVMLVDEAGSSICRMAFNNQTFELVGKSYHEETPLGAGTIEEELSNLSEISGVKIP
jgi:hypothetical protein